MIVINIIVIIVIVIIMIVVVIIMVDKPNKVVQTHIRCKRISNFQFNTKRHDFLRKRFGKKSIPIANVRSCNKATEIQLIAMNCELSPKQQVIQNELVSLKYAHFSHTSRLRGMHHAKEYHFGKNNFKSLSDISFQEKRFKNSEMVLSCIVHAT